MTKTAQETPQSALWRGAFGNEYITRNAFAPAMIRARIALWSRILGTVEGVPPRSILEVGANVGMNVAALKSLTDATIDAVEPNDMARSRMVETGLLPAERVHDGLAHGLPLGDKAVDMAFTSGVLIHIHPDMLEASLREIHRVAKRHVVCIEYFSDKLQEIRYHGHEQALFKQDFGGLWLDTCPDLTLVDYGFAWRRATGLDNLTWWVFEKRG